MTTALALDADPILASGITSAVGDQELGIEVLDDMIEEDFWDGFVVGAGIGATAGATAAAVGIALLT
jgi:hypothetical protein